MISHVITPLVYCVEAQVQRRTVIDYFKLLP